MIKDRYYKITLGVLPFVGWTDKEKPDNVLVFFMFNEAVTRFRAMLGEGTFKHVYDQTELELAECDLNELTEEMTKEV